MEVPGETPEVSGGAPQWPVCKAAQLARYVDEQINGAARQEFLDATSEIQAPGADLAEGSAYSDDTPLSFTMQSIVCDLCQGKAHLLPSGSVRAGRCKVSGSCELEWTTRYPDIYQDADGNLAINRLVCGAEVGCSALIRLVNINGKPVSSLSHGICEVAERGDNWRERRDEVLKAITCAKPEAGIEEFDGHGSSRES